jgi:NOP5NT (NUC127) domain
MAGGLLLLFETAAGYALFKVQDGVKIQAADAQVGCVGACTVCQQGWQQPASSLNGILNLFRCLAGFAQ